MTEQQTIGRTQRGVTLAEVLIALLIFSMIASASVFALRLGIDSREQLEEADAQLRSLQIARVLIKQDLAQVVDRPVRDEFGVAKPVSFSGGQISFGSNVEDDEEILMSFVRGGWLNPSATAPRSALQRVEYVLRDGDFIRRSHAYLDDAPNGASQERILFTGVTTAEAEFHIGDVRGELDWSEIWPLSSSSGGLPRAVAITVTRADEAPLRQLFWLGEAGL